MDDSLYIPYNLEKRIAALFNQEVWCWNRDIVASEGDLLISYGFTLYRNQNDKTQKMYTMRTNSYCVGLWEWGMYYGETNKGGTLLVLDTDTIRANYTKNDTTQIVYSPFAFLGTFSHQDVSILNVAYELILKAMVYIYNYEQWIHQQKGIAYRDKCVMDWVRPFCLGKDMKGQWEHMIFDFKQYIKRD